MGLNNPSSKYNYNRNYFKDIDTPQKAYWIGFIIGDGHLARDKRHLMFATANKDKQLLYNFIDNISGSKDQVKNVIQHSHYKISNLTISSKQMVNDLIKIGVPHKNKSSTAEPLDIPYQSAFWLGLFDADGSVGVYKWKGIIRRRSYICILLKVTLSGTKSICDGFSKFLGYGGRYVYKNGSVWVFDKAGKNICERIYSKLYEYDIPCLERKKQIFERWMDAEKIQY